MGYWYRCRYRWRMLFKFGLTIIVFVAIFMYYALRSADKEAQNQSGVDIEDRISQTVQEQSQDGVGLSTKNRHVDGDNMGNAQEGHKFDSKQNQRDDGIHVSLVACGDRLEESLVLLKSAVLFTSSHLIFHIFAEHSLQKQFQEELDFWPDRQRSRVEYRLYNITFPSTNVAKPDEWKKLFKPCASQRLFIPSILTDVDSLIYVDTDVLFLSALENIWAFFKQFNSTQMAALAPEHEDAAIGWYNRFARHPYYGELGVNSGVMLMNLTRIRQSPWLQSMLLYYREYRLKITWGDQDLINIYFHYHPDQLFVYPCEWNYRPDHCMYMSVCKTAEVHGVQVLHGSRRVWHVSKQPAFRAIYTAFKSHRLEVDIQYGLYESIKHHLDQASPSSCGKMKHIFLRQIEHYIQNSNS